METPEIITLTPEYFDNLKAEVSSSNLSTQTITLIIGIMQLCLWLQQKLAFSKISIAKLKKLFHIKTEKRKGVPCSKDNEPSTAPNVPAPNLAQTASVANNQSPAEPKKKRVGHGRLSADAYTNAEVVTVKHAYFAAGQPCPLGCGGKLYPLNPPGVFIRIEGGNLFNVYHYNLERLRCGLCSDIFTASLPEGITEKYDAKAKAIIAVQKYQMGIPWYRLAQWQEQIGQPIPDTTQWHLVLDVFSAAEIIFFYLITLGAQSAVFYQDDTLVRILSVMLENKREFDKKKRKGTFTTGIIAYHEEHPIYLFFSGTQHAGENLSNVLSHRDSTLPAPFQMCDALSRNAVEKYRETLLCHCLVHGRRQFMDIEAFFPEPCTFVLDSIGRIYHYEAQCKKGHFSPRERLHYHQQHSLPVMDQLKAFMQQQIDEKKVEPNSPLGDAYRYWLKRWSTLTRFLTYEGAPLDSNIVERGLKLAIRIRKNSLFHKTTRGAYVASVMMSVIHTALQSGIEPIAYLTALQEHQADVIKAPYDWLPWYYKNKIKDYQAVAA